jgi:hypothetical protein
MYIKKSQRKRGLNSEIPSARTSHEQRDIIHLQNEKYSTYLQVRKKCAYTFETSLTNYIYVPIQCDHIGNGI